MFCVVVFLRDAFKIKVEFGRNKVYNNRFYYDNKVNLIIKFIKVVCGVVENLKKVN